MTDEFRRYGVHLEFHGQQAEVEVNGFSAQAVARRAKVTGWALGWFEPDDEVRITVVDEGPVHADAAPTIA